MYRRLGRVAPKNPPHKRIKINLQKKTLRGPLEEKQMQAPAAATWVMMMMMMMIAARCRGSINPRCVSPDRFGCSVSVYSQRQPAVANAGAGATAAQSSSRLRPVPCATPCRRHRNPSSFLDRTWSPFSFFFFSTLSRRPVWFARLREVKKKKIVPENTMILWFCDQVWRGWSTGADEPEPTVEDNVVFCDCVRK